MKNQGGRPSKGLTEAVTVRLTSEERWMVDTLRDQFRCSLNDAFRVCVRRGYSRVAPSQEIDGPVLDPNWRPAPLPGFTGGPTSGQITGQTSIDMEADQ